MEKYLARLLPNLNTATVILVETQKTTTEVSLLADKSKCWCQQLSCFLEQAEMTFPISEVKGGNLSRKECLVLSHPVLALEEVILGN